MKAMVLFPGLFLPLVLTLFATKPPKETDEVKVFISVDMEGIGGVVHRDQVWSEGKDYDRARGWMTEEVNAAITGALAGGATEVLVNDSHGNMRNVLVENLHEKASLISGTPKPLSMMQGIDGSFDVVFFIGYHAGAGTEDGVLDHTYSSSTVSNVRINGKLMNEAGINAALAGYHGVPVGLVTGDSNAVEQTRALVGDVEGVVVKEAVGRTAAKVMQPKKAQALIRKAAQTAVERRDDLQPLKLEKSNTVEVDFLTSAMADWAEMIPGVERDGRTITYASDDFVTVFKALRAMIGLAYNH